MATAATLTVSITQFTNFKICNNFFNKFNVIPAYDIIYKKRFDCFKPLKFSKIVWKNFAKVSHLRNQFGFVMPPKISGA